MAKRETRKIRDGDIVGPKYFDRLMPLLERLHDVGTRRDRAGSRQLFFDHSCACLLLFLFNPIVTSLRGIQQASELKKVRRKLGCPRAALGSLSEATRVFDPEPVKPIARELALQLEPLGHPRQFPAVRHLVTAVDGTVVKTLARIVQAAYLRSPTDDRSLSAWRLHTHFDVGRGLPVRIDVTGAGTQGDNDERAVPRGTLQSDRCCVLDRGYAQFVLFNAIVASDSSYVCRVWENSVYEVVEERPRSAEAAASRVTFDAVVRMGQERKGDDKPGPAMHLIFIATTPHHKRGRRGGGTAPHSDGVLRIATDFECVQREDPQRKKIALLATAHYLVRVMWALLKHGTSWKEKLATAE